MQMQFIEFDKEKCDSCYKCLRVCPTKAISFNKQERKILDDKCIKCGLCQAHCPQGALTIKSSIDRVKASIKAGNKVAISIAPSYMGAFEMTHPDQMATALKKLGFHIIEETSVGAEVVAKSYEHYIKENAIENIITTCCPSATYYIENNYPELIPYMIPVVSPMVAHGRSLKKRCGEEAMVVFIGPCLAKMAEAKELVGAIDEVITFDDLYKWFEEEKIDLKELEKGTFNRYGTKRSKAFPLGVDLDIHESVKYKVLRVDGIDDCEIALDDLKKEALTGYLIEINICDGGCMNGPEMPKNNRSRFQREMFMKDFIKEKKTSNNQQDEYPTNEIIVKRTFECKKKEQGAIDDKIIKDILLQMGKYNQQDELNCGACGYKTCLEKATAVYYGHSDVQNCLAYLRAKAENMHSVMIENSPNGVCIIDRDLFIVENNKSFDNLFNDMDMKLTGMPIFTFFKEELFAKALAEKKTIRNQKMYVELVDKHFIINIVYLEKEEMLLAFFTDITDIEKKKSELEMVKKETLLKTQEVIEKQMRVAQEIASLLGETTAETKMSLNSLKDLVLSDEGGL
jgi:iron only hydrogenase large subunit-like protein